MLDQYGRMLLQIAEARRMHGTHERFGSVHQVWRKNGEQKIRVNVGMRPDGSPWLTPWLKVDSHHGALREQHKFHMGQNVKVQAVGADFSQAVISPHGENTMHPEPNNADDYNATKQYAQHFHRVGPDFEEKWVADTDALQQQSQGVDPDKASVALYRVGGKPQTQQDKDEPWEGPPPKGGNPQKRHLAYAGAAGNTPTQTGDVITSQFDKNVKTEHTLQGILHKIQSMDGAAMMSPDNGLGSALRTTIDKFVDANILRKIQDLASGKITSTVHMNGDITHEIQDAQGNIARITQQMNQIIHQLQSSGGVFSMITQQAGGIMHQVTDQSGTSTIRITGAEISINSKSVNVNTDTLSTPSTPPAEPALNSNGDAPLLPLFPVFWQTSAVFSPAVVIQNNRQLTDLFTVAAVLHANASIPLQFSAGILHPTASLAQAIALQLYTKTGLTLSGKLGASITSPQLYANIGLHPSGSLGASGTVI